MRYKTQIILHYYCEIAEVDATPESLLLYVEGGKFCTSKWRRILEGSCSPSPKTMKDMKKALTRTNVKKSKIDEFTRLYNSPIWQVLQVRKIIKKDEHVIVSRLPANIQSAIATRQWDTFDFEVIRKNLKASSVNKLEKISTLESLAALILRLRIERYYPSECDDLEVQSAVFRMFLSFCHHPSFFKYLPMLWPHLTSLVVKSDALSLNRMATGFWNYTVDDIKKIVNGESEVHKLAKAANIIEDHTDIPSFNYLYYRDTNKKEILASLRSIANSQKTKMMTLDGFYFLLKKLRRKGKYTLDFPTLSFPHLCIE